MKRRINLKFILSAVLSLAILLNCALLVGCNKTDTDGNDVVIGLIALHDENSTYDKNFIDAFKLACDNAGVKYYICRLVWARGLYDRSCERIPRR